MNAREELRIRLAIPLEHANILDKLSEEEIRTCRCESCDSVIKVYPDGAWRFRIHVIRCPACIAKLQRSGISAFDARYVV